MRWQTEREVRLRPLAVASASSTSYLLRSKRFIPFVL